MIKNDLLIEKFKVQKRLSVDSIDIHDYFRKTHESVKLLCQKYGISFNYQKLPNKLSYQSEKKVVGFKMQ